MAKTLLDVSHIMRGIYPLTPIEQIEAEEKQYAEFIAKINASKGQVVFPFNGRGKTNDVRETDA